MYFEEKIINGVLCFRTTPDAEFEPVSAAVLTSRVHAAEAKLAKAKEALHQCIGNLKALGAEGGWGAEYARKAISEIEES